MEAKLFFKRCKENYQNLLDTLGKIETEKEGDMVGVYEHSLMEVDESIRTLKRLVQKTLFRSAADEVYFFKELKPLFVSQFIFYSKVLSIEVAKPNAGQHILKDYYEFELQHLKNFVDEYGGFYEYYRRKATYLDEKYFLRHQFDFKMNTDVSLHNYDTDFTTSHDHLIAQIMANDRLEHYLLQSVHRLDGYFHEKFSPKSPITWTASKSALVELLYALHSMQCFNNGRIEMSEISRFLEKTFNIELGNVYKTLHEIKNRKTGRTKFLQALDERLNRQFDESEG